MRHLILILSLISFSNVLQAQSVVKEEGLTDVEGNKYKTVVMENGQAWMAENLNVGSFRNGDKILHATTEKEWKDACDNKIPAWCYYQFSSENSAL